MIDRFLQYQKILSQVIEIANVEDDIDTVIKKAFTKLIALPWLSFSNNASFSLVLQNEAYIATNHHHQFPLKCKIDKSQMCNCSKITTIDQITECKNADNKNTNNSVGSHFCIPFRWNNQPQAILILQSTKKPDNIEIELLKTVTSLIENIINSRKKTEELLQKAQQQNILNQKLFSQSLEIDQKNIEIKENEIKIKEQVKELLASEEELRQNNEELLVLNEHLNEANNVIVEKNRVIGKSHKQIKDSINYAQTIQESLLTKKELIDTYFNDYFILFKPKEQVSGDFYYVNKVGKNIIIAAADCTGHGVPGGFITMLGITYLHGIVRRNEMVNPGIALNDLRNRFKEVFSTFGSESRNGLDMALCLINTETNVLQYAGAYNPLIIIRDNELIEYKATRNPIGAYPKEREFQNNEIQLQNNDLLYLFSDGFQDQFGGLNKRKFQRKRLKELFLEIHKLTMKEQKQRLTSVFNDWKGDLEQVDDLLVMGVLIKTE